MLYSILIFCSKLQTKMKYFNIQLITYGANIYLNRFRLCSLFYTTIYLCSCRWQLNCYFQWLISMWALVIREQNYAQFYDYLLTTLWEWEGGITIAVLSVSLPPRQPNEFQYCMEFIKFCCRRDKLLVIIHIEWM